MPTASMKRSQAILRMPVDMVDAVMILQNGERSEVLVMLPPSEDLTRFISEGGRFLPVNRDASTIQVARSALAAFGIPKRLAPRLDDDLPVQQQKVRVVLVGGVQLDGVICWVGAAGCGEHLNGEAAYFPLQVGDTTYLVMKTGVVTVTEL